MTHARFTLVDGADAAALLTGLALRERLVPTDTVTLDRTVYDTFDWRLWGAGTVLEHERPAGSNTVGSSTPRLVWRDRHTGEVLGRISTDSVARFGRDLPTGPTADRITKILDVRALEPLAELRSERRTLGAVDDEDKTVARVVLETTAPSPSTPARTTVEVHAVRGYDRHADRLARVLGAQVVLEPGAADTAAVALEANTRKPGGYTSKLVLALDENMTASELWTTVLHTLLSVLQANDAGVRADTDPEFLHDFRVAVRRSRSVLAQARHVLPAKDITHYGAELRWLGEITSPVRDLDVELLEVPAYEAALPDNLTGELAPLHDLLLERQRAAHADLVAALDSDRYTTLIESYTEWLDHPGHDDALDLAGAPGPSVTASRIRKAFRRVLRDGRSIDDRSAPERLHDLRKDTKRLRYALECYGSVFPDDLVRPVVKPLKALQDCLGEFQDCEVQAISLRSVADELLATQRCNAGTLMAIGHLVDRLDERQRLARAQFDNSFAGFDRPEVRDRIERISQIGRDADERTDPAAATTQGSRP